MENFELMIIKIFKRAVLLGVGSVLIISGIISLAFPVIPGIVLIFVGFSMAIRGAGYKEEDIGLMVKVRVFKNNILIKAKKYFKQQATKFPFF
ncbi:hypothetical protein K8R32_05155 [bacterium]|nr:hypothetical protein [bacterium]